MKPRPIVVGPDRLPLNWIEKYHAEQLDIDHDYIEFDEIDGAFAERQLTVDEVLRYEHAERFHEYWLSVDAAGEEYCFVRVDPKLWRCNDDQLRAAVRKERVYRDLVECLRSVHTGTSATTSFIIALVRTHSLTGGDVSADQARYAEYLVRCRDTNATAPVASAIVLPAIVSLVTPSAVSSATVPVIAAPTPTGERMLSVDEHPREEQRRGRRRNNRAGRGKAREPMQLDSEDQAQQDWRDELLSAAPPTPSELQHQHRIEQVRQQVMSARRHGAPPAAMDDSVPLTAVQHVPVPQPVSAHVIAAVLDPVTAANLQRLSGITDCRDTPRLLSLLQEANHDVMNAAALYFDSVR